VQASWNGATEVASWRVLAGQHPHSLAPRSTIPASGFESESILPEKWAYVAVQALDASGHTLGTSATASVTSFASSLPSTGTTG
jgi:hypothetical protein